MRYVLIMIATKFLLSSNRSSCLCLVIENWVKSLMQDKILRFFCYPWRRSDYAGNKLAFC